MTLSTAEDAITMAILRLSPTDSAAGSARSMVERNILKGQQLLALYDVCRKHTKERDSEEWRETLKVTQEKIINRIDAAAIYEDRSRPG